MFGGRFCVRLGSPARLGRKLIFTLRAGDQDIALEGVVRHSADQEGMGIQFTKVSPVSKRRLRILLASLSIGSWPTYAGLAPPNCSALRLNRYVQESPSKEAQIAKKFSSHWTGYNLPHGWVLLRSIQTSTLPLWIAGQDGGGQSHERCALGCIRRRIG